MHFKETQRKLPLVSLLKLLLAVALVLQFFILAQVYFYRHDIFSDPVMLVIRLFRGVVASFLAGLMLAAPALAVIRLLNRNFSWNKYPFARFLIQFIYSILAGFIITPLLLIPAGWMFGLEADLQTIINNSYYMIVLSFFLMLILEARLYFDEFVHSKIVAAEMENRLKLEAARQELLELQNKSQEEKNKLIHEMMEEEKTLNYSLKAEIEKREEIARQLHEKREQLHSLLSNLMGAAFRCRYDEYYTMEYISEKIPDITGYDASDLISGKVSYKSIVYPDDFEALQRTIDGSIESNSHYETEYRLVHRNGNMVWVNETGKCIFDEDGKVVFLDGIIMDITRRKEAELAVKESERNYKDLMDFLPQPVFELNLEGQIMFSNKAGDDFFGKLPENPKNRPPAISYFIKEDIPRIIENFRKSGLGIHTEPGEFTAIRADGSLCPVMIFGNPIVRNGRITGRRGIIIDISERKKYELGLLQAKKELEQINNNLENILAERSRELTQTNDRLFKAQKENLQSQFEVLRQQINPHFLFNSLNVLSGLISKDPAQAQLFIDEFSQIYRYVLEAIEQHVATLGKELEFVRSYMYLQQMRYGDALTWSINIPASLLDLVIPPLSLQVVLENALKHNIVNDAKPLLVEIFAIDKTLIVKNRLQPKISKGISTGLGLKNLVKRYALISSKTPVFMIENHHYVAVLPLINTDNDERTDS
jgi:PAS domain S-box-containing protein